MTGFLDYQERARRNTGFLVFLFLLAVAGVIAGVYLTALVALFLMADESVNAFFQLESFGFGSFRLGVACTGLVFLCIGVATWMKTRAMHSGAQVARSLGARRVDSATTDPAERALRNVVEEMAIATGIRIPDVYLMERERGINAFAAGLTHDDAVVCVTHGALALLDRDELQGVVAHEFSHIVNADTTLNLRLIGWLHGILILGLMGRAIVKTRSSSIRSRIFELFVGWCLEAVGYAGFACGSAIKVLITRQREYLADASAVQFTRNPDGLAGALKKIGGLTRGGQIGARNAEEASHLFFADALKPSALRLASTHPPLDERIRRLDPGFDGVYPAVTPLPPPSEESPDPSRQPAQDDVRPAPGTAAETAEALPAAEAPSPILQEHLAAARRLIETIPEPLRAASRVPQDACALVYALLIDPDPAVRALQEERLTALDDPDMRERTRGLLPAVAHVAPEARLPLLDLCLPALHALTPTQYERLSATTAALVDADARESLFEFLLHHLLERHLAPRFVPRAAPQTQIYGITGVLNECVRILSTVARIGNPDEAAAQAAFASGMRTLQIPDPDRRLLPARECVPARLHGALTRLSLASVPIRRHLLAACQECLVHDRVVTPDEGVLLRALADALGCPLPAGFTP